MSHRSSLYFYFLSRLFGYFTAVLLVSTATFLCSYYLLTVRFFSGAVISMHFFYYLTPQIFSYTIPFSCVFALGVQQVHSVAGREYLVRKLLRHAQRAWWRARFTLGLACLLFFAGVIGWWGPLSHSAAKKTLVPDVVELSRSIQPQAVTQLGSQLRIWYARRLGSCWYQVRLLRTHDDGSVVLLSARLGQHSPHSLVLYSGTILRIDGEKQSRSDFTIFTLSYQEIDSAMPSFAVRRPKHFSVSELLEQPASRSISQELWRRALQIFLFMFVMLAFGLIIENSFITQLMSVVVCAGAILVFIHVGSSLLSFVMS